MILEREGGRERKTSVGCLPNTPQPGTEPASKVCALTGSQTHELLVHGMTLQPTEPRQPGPSVILCAEELAIHRCGEVAVVYRALVVGGRARITAANMKFSRTRLSWESA